MINVLYVTYASENFDGATYSLMDLIKSVQKHVNPIVMLRSYGCVYEYFTKNGIECIVCDFQEDIVHIPKNIYQFLKYAYRLIPNLLQYKRRNRDCVDYIYNQLRGREIEIVHTNNTVMSVGYNIAKKLGARHIWHLRGFMDLDFGWMPLKGWRYHKRTIAKSDAIIGITPTVLKHFISQKANNTYTIFNGVRSRNNTCYVYPKEKYFLFCSGFVTKKKGCEFAIHSFAKSELYSQGYRLRIIGEVNKTYKRYLTSLIESLSITQYVDFIGRVNDVKEHMKHATAFLMCSEFEGLGRVSVEAMFNGCLVLGRNSGGTKDFIFDNETGFLFNNINECAQAMKNATFHDNHEIIHKAQIYACTNFSTEDYGGKILNVYKQVLFK